MDSKNPMNAPRRPSDGSKNHHKDKEGGCPASVIGFIGCNDRVIAVSKEMLNEEDLTQGKQGHKLRGPPLAGAFAAPLGSASSFIGFERIR